MIPTHTIEAYGSTYEVIDPSRNESPFGFFIEGEYRLQGDDEWQGLGTFPGSSKVTDLRVKPTHILHVTYYSDLGQVSYEVVNPTIGENGFEARQYRVVGMGTAWTGPGGFAFHQTTVEAVR